MTDVPRSDHTAALLAKLKQVRSCMFATTDSSGDIKSHPMTLEEVDGEDNFWFFTSDQTHLARDIPAKPQVNLSFADPADSLYVSVSGRASLVRDRAKIAELWNPIVAAWFPAGQDDPHLTLVKVTTHGAEFWDSKSSKMVQLYKIAKAALIGETPKAAAGEHGKVNL